MLNVLCVANVERCTRVHIHPKNNINTYYIQVKCWKVTKVADSKYEWAMYSKSQSKFLTRLIEKKARNSTEKKLANSNE